jgi:DNA repair exonuclease SbcCD nuclease subunit
MLKMVHYTLVSDLHCDANNGQPADFDTEWVIVAGDTANSVPQAVSVLNKYVQKGHRVFAVDGNHEHYGNHATGASLTTSTEQFYRTGRFDFGFAKMTQDIYLIGTNGWYPVQDEQHWRGYMLDGGRISVPGDYLTWMAAREAAYVGNCLRLLKPRQKAIVVTHTAPCEESLDPQYAGSEGNQYFYNPDMFSALYGYRNRIIAWHHGHTHASMSVEKHGVPIITNPRGYPGENENWKPLVLEAKL